ncbi:uncharacterized protein LOC121393333 [Xenopus laevis]|uniref:Uncharacterized protein LOC121393333 n=1 Tax=Xenopus laevis TaxID=8355 RepID=A0A8J1KL76_XENLA|nr:uncharacterized protein LOC121393333 [Xenopus laevis]XP_041417484.1 uncharacterized protein LOC121393333 [Xenopus laevis]
MGTSTSKQCKINPNLPKPDMGSPNVRFMSVNYGVECVQQLHEWVKLGFPETGSFSINQLQQLKGKLRERESDIKMRLQKKEKVFKSELLTLPDWESFDKWLNEAQKRNRKSQAGKEREWGAQGSCQPCMFREKEDLSAPPHRRGQAEAAEAEDPPQYEAGLQPLLYPEMPTLTPQVTPTKSPTSLASAPQVFGNFPMIEVAGADGNTQWVFRPWLLNEMKEVAKELPDLIATGGNEYAKILEQIVHQFRPTTEEVRRLMTVAMGLRWRKVEHHLPANDTRYGWADGDLYRTILTTLFRAIETTFPPRSDIKKIAACVQKGDERVSDYLVRLTKVYEDNIGIPRPNRPEGGGEPALGPWESHLRDYFVKGLLPKLREQVQQNCVDCDAGRLAACERFATHTRSACTARRKRNRKRSDRKHLINFKCFS